MPNAYDSEKKEVIEQQSSPEQASLNATTEPYQEKETAIASHDADKNIASLNKGVDQEENELLSISKESIQEDEKNLPSSNTSVIDTTNAEGEIGVPSNNASLSKEKEETKVVAPNKDIKKTVGFFKSHPIQAVPVSTPSVATNLYNTLAYLPWLILIVLLVGQVILTLDARSLWFSDEIRHANAFQSMLHNHKWFVLEMNGELYPDKPPLYFWFLYGIYLIIQSEGPMLYFTAAALSALVYLCATSFLGRIAGRLDGRTILAAGIMLLSTGYFIGITHYARMDLLFAAFILFSQTFFFVAITKKRSITLMILAFTFAALACLTKGPLGVAFPLLSVLMFLCWKGTPLRLLKIDVLAGLIIGIFIVAGWVVGIIIETNGPDFFIHEVLEKNIIQRALNTFHHAEKWHYYLIRIPLMTLPWTLLLFCLPWNKLFSKSMRDAIATSRTSQSEGIAFLWSIVLSSVLLLSLLSGKILIYFLPALPALYLLGGRAILQLAGKRAIFFRFLLIIFMLLAGLSILVASLILFGTLPTPSFKGIPEWHLPINSGFFLVSIVCFITAFALWFLIRKSSPEGMLLIVAFFSVIFTYPLCKMAMPALDEVLSPKSQAQKMRDYIEQGYYPISYNVYGGTYTYYAEHNIQELTNIDDVHSTLEKYPKVVLGTKLSDWEKLNIQQNCIEVHKQWIETKEYILATCDRSSSKDLQKIEENTIDVSPNE